MMISSAPNCTVVPLAYTCLWALELCHYELLLLVQVLDYLVHVLSRNFFLSLLPVFRILFWMDIFVESVNVGFVLYEVML